jgi:hypothetical protein
MELPISRGGSGLARGNVNARLPAGLLRFQLRPNAGRVLVEQLPLGA